MAEIAYLIIYAICIAITLFFLGLLIAAHAVLTKHGLVWLMALIFPIVVFVWCVILGALNDLGSKI